MASQHQIRDNDWVDRTHPAEIIEPVETTHHDLSGALLRIVIWQISGISIESIAARTLVLSETLSLNIRPLTWAEIAEHTGLTRAAVQLMAKELEDQFSLKSHNARNETTRKKCKQAQININKKQERK